MGKQHRVQDCIMAGDQVLSRVFRVQRALEVLGTLLLTAYLYPRQAEINEFNDYDMIVVGGGSAGTVVAFRLAECNFKVLLVEAGGNPPLQSMLPGLFTFLYHSEYDWYYINIHDGQRFQCHQNETLSLQTGRSLGGCSSTNYMIYVRGCPDDYRYWAEAANDSSWDYNDILVLKNGNFIGKDLLLPLFIKSERLEDAERSRTRSYHGTKGFLGVTMGVIESFKELGHDILLDINGERSLGYTDQLYTIAEGVRQSTAYSILAKYRNLNLHVLRHTTVTKILFDGNNNAIGVKAISENNTPLTLIARKEVILSAGAFNTPQILMLSGIGPKNHLESLNIPVRKDLPVGRNLHEHPTVILSIQIEESHEPPPPVNPHKFPFTVIGGYVALNKYQRCPTYQTINLIAPAGSTLTYELCSFTHSFDLNICENIYRGAKFRNMMLTWLTLLHPESRGEMLLRSTYPLDPPVIEVGYLQDSRDVETLVDSAFDFLRVLNTTHFRNVKANFLDLKLEMCEDLAYMSRAWWRCYVRCMQTMTYHYVGTCALGLVVGNKLRVMGVGRLRVVDASIMPRVVGGYTNAPTTAIGEKGAEIIKKDHFCTGSTRRPRSSD